MTNLKIYIKREIKGLRFGWKLTHNEVDYSKYGKGGMKECFENLNKHMKKVDADWKEVVSFNQN